VRCHRIAKDRYLLPGGYGQVAALWAQLHFAHVLGVVSAREGGCHCSALVYALGLGPGIQVGACSGFGGAGSSRSRPRVRGGTDWAKVYHGVTVTLYPAEVWNQGTSTLAGGVYLNEYRRKSATDQQERKKGYVSKTCRRVRGDKHFRRFINEIHATIA